MVLNLITSKAFLKAKKISVTPVMKNISGAPKHVTELLSDVFNSSKVKNISIKSSKAKTLTKNFTDFLNLKSLKKKKIKKILPKLNKSADEVADFTKKYSDDFLKITKKNISKTIDIGNISKLKNIAGKLFFDLKFSKLKSKVEYFVKVLQPFIQKEKMALNNKLLKNYKLQKIDYKLALNKYDSALRDYTKMIVSGDIFKIKMAKNYLDKSKYDKEIALKYLNKAKDMASEI